MPKNEERGAEATSHIDSTKKKKYTQEDKVLAYMKKHGSITTLEAVTELYIMNPQQRIGNLRKRGYNITTEYITSPTGKRYGVYKLRGEVDV